MHYFVDGWKQTFDFKGRAARKPFWMFILFNFMVTLILMMLSLVQGPLTDFMTIVYTVYSLACILPILSFNVRRLHDIKRSGWLVLLYLLPLIGGLVMLYFLCQKGETA